MTVELDAIGQRVLGCLMEKAVITPDQYPMTINALTNACNQKSSRHPVMSLSSGEVTRALRDLETLHVVSSQENFKSQTEKYIHRFCNTPFSDYQFDPAEYAIMTVLLLRGPRTPGELRANSGRLHTFADNSEVVTALDGLMQREGEPLVAMLPRQPGRKDSEYVHLFGDEAAPVVEMDVARTPASPSPTQQPALEQRVAALEQEVARLRQLIE